MPDAWSEKEERMYERIQKSAAERGKSAERASEVAARTVNKYRREHGETPDRQSSGTGNPNVRLEERTVRELRNRARELGIDGRSKMNKAGLIRAIRRH